MLLSTWLSVAGICALGAMSPGPSLAVVVNNTVHQGRNAGLLTALGHGLGVTLYAALTALGLAVIIAGSPLLFDVIRYCGAAFLLYLAWGALRAGSASTEPDHSSEAKRAGSGFTSGLLIAALNPKMAIFFLALFSQFVDPQAGLGDKLLLAFTAGLIDTLWYLLVAWSLAKGPALAWLRAHRLGLNRSFAVIIALLALSILLR